MKKSRLDAFELLERSHKVGKLNQVLEHLDEIDRLKRHGHRYKDIAACFGMTPTAFYKMLAKAKALVSRNPSEKPAQVVRNERLASLPDDTLKYFIRSEKTK